ncbi:12514_t:CDS:1 [Racocetra fulgida]|uniref:12514_t:CDS:1 n=1 Tax=Racocetra fulgida TaxID=60492 RepID=A0A9N9CW66_9GLOM|nr:12514_t:CDS:1 [Racocetra fulgida]
MIITCQENLAINESRLSSQLSQPSIVSDWLLAHADLVIRDSESATHPNYPIIGEQPIVPLSGINDERTSIPSLNFEFYLDCPVELAQPLQIPSLESMAQNETQSHFNPFLNFYTFN